MEEVPEKTIVNYTSKAMNNADKSFKNAQANYENSVWPEYWEVDQPPTWGNDFWESRFIDCLAAHYVKGGGTHSALLANADAIFAMIEKGETAEEGHAWEYLAESWVETFGEADDFLRLLSDLARVISFAQHREN